MIVGPEVAGVIIVAAALWVALGVLIAILAARRLRRAQAVLGAARTMRSLLDAAPARAMLVHADGRIEADGKLLRSQDALCGALRPLHGHVNVPT